MEEKILKHKDSFDINFNKFKHNVDYLIDDSKNVIIDMTEIEEDLKHCYKKYCLRCCLNKICCIN